MARSFDLSLQADILPESEKLRALMAENSESAAFGLSLSPEQAQELIAVQAGSLRAAGRIELGCGPAPLLAAAFCSSPYMNSENYAPALAGLVELFYTFKNETMELVSDRALISYMARAFNGPCRGSVELLAGEYLPRLVKKVNERRGRAPEFEVTDDR